MSKIDEFGYTGPMYRNKNCMTCKYRTRSGARQSHGFCNYLSITGHSRLLAVGSSETCPGFKGKILKPKKNTAIQRKVDVSFARRADNEIYGH